MWLAFHGSGRGARTRENHPRRPDLNPGVLRVRRDGSPRGIREPFQFHELRRLPGTSCLRKRRLSAAWEQLQSREIRDWQPLQTYNLYTFKPTTKRRAGRARSASKALSELVHFAGAQSPSRVAQNERHGDDHARGGALGAAAALDLSQLQL